ncbi:MAG: T9SS type A sorting domain-containing protein [Bacteroidales bacterium]|nr:T9SS type A sorting domain-containing protein [Bacteroidales bacterium]
MKWIVLPLAILANILFININAQQQNFPSDVIIDGSLGIGMDIPETPTWGFNTMILSENNLRILFDDSSQESNIANFPANDWIIEINDHNQNGKNYFAVRDATANKIPFLVEAGARSDALYVSKNNHIGFGINNPNTELHITCDNTPTIRLDQSASGWGNQAWDIGGNETNFFIRDASVGSLLPVRIRPKAPTNSLFIDSTGFVGLGSENPSQKLEVAGNAKINGVMKLQALSAQPLEPSEGDIYFDGTNKRLKYYDSTEWKVMGQKQSLSLSNHELSIDDGNTVSLTAYLDNTDQQLLQFLGTELTISNGNTVDLSILQDGFEANTDEQQLLIDGTQLSISNGNTVDLDELQDGFEANTDEQVLSVSGTDLSISGGNTVDLSSMLEDIVSRMDDQDNLIASQTIKIEELQADIALLKTQVNTNTGVINPSFSGAKLYQNTPNPSNNGVEIKYYVPESTSDAKLLVYDLNGKLYKNYSIKSKGINSVEITKNELNAGTYLYTLLVDGKKAATKKMVIIN